MRWETPRGAHAEERFLARKEVSERPLGRVRPRIRRNAPARESTHAEERFATGKAPFTALAHGGRRRVREEEERTHTKERKQASRRPGRNRQGSTGRATEVTVRQHWARG